MAVSLAIDRVCLDTGTTALWKTHQAFMTQQEDRVARMRKIPYGGEIFGPE
jgi:hypothetical protein